MGSRPTRRAPVLLPARWSGLDLRDARTTRVEVRGDRSIVVTTADGERVVAGPDEVTRLVVVPAGAMPAWAPARPQNAGVIAKSEHLMVLSGERVCLVVRLRDFSANAEDLSSTWALTQRDSSGAEALAAALGMPLEGARPADLALLATPEARAAALLFPLSGVDRPRWATPSVILAMVIAFLSWMRGYGWDAALVALIGAAVLAPMFVRVHRLRREFRRVVDTLPALPDCTTLAPAAPTTRGMAQARLLVSPERVVLHGYGREVAAAGPALGGVTHCLMSQAISFMTATKVIQLNLGRPSWCPTPADTDRFVAACHAAGITCDVLPEDPEMPLVLDEGVEGRMVNLIGTTVPYAYQTGSVRLGLPWLLIVATGMLTVTALINAVVAPLDDQAFAQTWCWGIPLTVVFGAAFVTTVADSLRIAAWDRHHRRKVRHVPA